MMLCDELKVYEEMEDYVGYDNDTPTEMYDKSEVDAAIAELKAIVTTDNSAVIARLEEQLRKTQRSLWLARAKNCKWAALYFWYGYTDKPKSIRYEKAEAKCFKKAEEYE